MELLAGANFAAMRAFLYVGGLRRTELASLRLSDYLPVRKDGEVMHTDPHGEKNATKKATLSDQAVYKMVK